MNIESYCVEIIHCFYVHFLCEHLGKKQEKKIDNCELNLAQTDMRSNIKDSAELQRPTQTGMSFKCLFRLSVEP